MRRTPGRQTARGVTTRLRDRVAAALADAGVGRGDPVVVACSHGPDSLALADAVLALRGRRVGDVTLVYVDHALRPGSSEEGDRVAAFARAHDAAARVVRVKLDRRRGGGLEEAARAARYQALDAVADEQGARWIVLGHTASDQAETVIARLIRGAGVVGLAGIPPVRGRYVRPLLDTTRAEVVAYLAARRLTPSHDETNESDAFLRNRIRTRILPVLRAENPRIDAALTQAAAALRELSEALDWGAARALATLELRREPDGGWRFAAAPLATLPAPLAKRVVTRLASELGVSLEARHMDSVLELCRRAGKRSITLPRLSASRERGDVILRPAASNPASLTQPDPTANTR
jgi:tRNA(Ile)-lysidine synthase